LGASACGAEVSPFGMWGSAYTATDPFEQLRIKNLPGEKGIPRETRIFSNNKQTCDDF
jgi:hypothetical protein